MELNILELNKDDYPIESSPLRNKLLEELKRASNAFNLKKKDVKPPVIKVLYGRKSASNQLLVTDFNRKDWIGTDDISISVLRADLCRILRDVFSKGEIDGIPFTLVLDFGDLGKEEAVEYNSKPEADAEAQNREVLNVLPVSPRFSLEQMVLPEDVEQDIMDVVTLVRSRKKIYEDWGFAEVDPVARAVINFHGAPGTGKTMAAHALAKEFGMKILALNYADIESKYVGDAPKNLMAAFRTAAKHDAVLFFDEADSFLGKRINNVTQSADQAVNSLRSQMLMLLEEHQGVVVFATNLIENYDSAFKSRILKHVHFELPNKELRIKLIKKMLPDSIPRNVEDFSDKEIDMLADISDHFSGREIKNAILNGLIISARDKDYFSFEDAKSGFEKVSKSLAGSKNPISSEVQKNLEKQIRRKLGWKNGKKKMLSSNALGYNLIKAGKV